MESKNDLIDKVVNPYIIKHRCIIEKSLKTHKEEEKQQKKDMVGIKAQILEHELKLTAEEFKFQSALATSPEAREKQRIDQALNREPPVRIK